MADFLISDWEMEALYGASGAAVKLYLALRSRMDYASCKAGLKRACPGMCLVRRQRRMLRADRGSRSNARRCDRCGRRPKTLIGAVLCAVLAMTNCWFLLPFAVVKQARPNQTRQSDVRVASGVTGQDTRQGQIRQTSSRRNGFRHHCAALPGSLQGRVASGL